jgi:hypothetical protein
VVYTPPTILPFNLNTFNQTISSNNDVPPPPTSHLLHFWAIGVTIAINKVPEDRHGSYMLTFPGDKGKAKRYFGRITLKQEWR